MSMYHEGHRELQDRYRGRAVADRLEQHRMHRVFTDTDREFIETAHFFFLATAWGESVFRQAAKARESSARLVAKT